MAGPTAKHTSRTVYYFSRSPVGMLGADNCSCVHAHLGAHSALARASQCHTLSLAHVNRSWAYMYVRMITRSFASQRRQNWTRSRPGSLLASVGRSLASEAEMTTNKTHGTMFFASEFQPTDRSRFRAEFGCLGATSSLRTVEASEAASRHTLLIYWSRQNEGIGNRSYILPTIQASSV